MKRTQEEARAILRLEKRIHEVWFDEQTRLDIATVLDLLRKIDSDSQEEKGNEK